MLVRTLPTLSLLAMAMLYPGLPCACRDQDAYPRPTHAARLSSAANDVASSRDRIITAGKSVMELGKTVVLPALGYKAGKATTG